MRPALWILTDAEGTVPRLTSEDSGIKTNKHQYLHSHK